MELFDYVAKDEKGRTLKGKVEARDESQAAGILRGRQMVVISIKPLGGSLQIGFLSDMLERVKQEDILNMTSQLSTMINSGLPLTEALEILRVQSKPAMAKIMNEVLRDVQGGMGLADAMARREGVFSNVYLALVRAGEASGKLDEILKRLAETEEKRRQFRAKTKGAMVYPTIVVIAMVLVVAILMIVVVPQLTTMYSEFGADLPFATVLLIAISDFFRTLWWLMLIAIGGAIYAIKQYHKTKAGRLQLDQLLLKIPIMGPLRRESIMTDFAMTLALLVGAGVSILQSLEIVVNSMDNEVYRRAVEKAKKGVEKGMPLAAMLAKQQVFPPLVPQMISVGEETGELEKVLEKVAQYFETQVDQKIKNLTTAIEPLIMIVLGVVVGFIVFAIITPLYKITELF